MCWAQACGRVNMWQLKAYISSVTVPAVLLIISACLSMVSITGVFESKLAIPQPSGAFQGYLTLMGAYGFLGFLLSVCRSWSVVGGLARYFAIPSMLVILYFSMEVMEYFLVAGQGIKLLGISILALILCWVMEMSLGSYITPMPIIIDGNGREG